VPRRLPCCRKGEWNASGTWSTSFKRHSVNVTSLGVVYSLRLHRVKRAEAGLSYRSNSATYPNRFWKDGGWNPDPLESRTSVVAAPPRPPRQRSDGVRGGLRADRAESRVSGRWFGAQPHTSRRPRTVDHARIFLEGTASRGSTAKERAPASAWLDAASFAEQQIGRHHPGAGRTDRRCCPKNGKRRVQKRRAVERALTSRVTAFREVELLLASSVPNHAYSLASQDCRVGPPLA